MVFLLLLLQIPYFINFFYYYGILNNASVDFCLKFEANFSYLEENETFSKPNYSNLLFRPTLTDCTEKKCTTLIWQVTPKIGAFNKNSKMV